MSIEEITARIRAFRDERDWKQFHNPKEMAVGIAVEAAELLEHFNWKTPGQCERIAVEKKSELAEEMADVAILLFEMADNIGVNLPMAIGAKLAKNAINYPRLCLFHCRYLTGGRHRSVSNGFRLFSFITG